MITVCGSELWTLKFYVIIFIIMFIKPDLVKHVTRTRMHCSFLKSKWYLPPLECTSDTERYLYSPILSLFSMTLPQGKNVRDIIQCSFTIHYVFRVSNNPVVAKKKKITITIIHKEIEWFSQEWRNPNLIPISLAPGRPLSHNPCRPSAYTEHRATPIILKDFNSRLHFPKSGSLFIDYLVGGSA